MSSNDSKSSNNAKRRRIPKGSMKFTSAMEKHFPFIKRTTSDSDVRCDICGHEFNIAGLGAYGLKRHLKMQKHLSHLTTEDAAAALEPFDSGSNDSHDDDSDARDPTSSTFSSKQMKMLKQTVQESPCLWDKSQYYDLNGKRKAWNLVAKNVGKSVETCKKKWIGNRDRYVYYNKWNNELKNKSVPGAKLRFKRVDPELSFLSIGREIPDFPTDLPSKTSSSENESDDDYFGDKAIASASAAPDTFGSDSNNECMSQVSESQSKKRRTRGITSATRINFRNGAVDADKKWWIAQYALYQKLTKTQKFEMKKTISEMQLKFEFENLHDADENEKTEEQCEPQFIVKTEVGYDDPLQMIVP